MIYCDLNKEIEFYELSWLALSGSKFVSKTEITIAHSIYRIADFTRSSLKMAYAERYVSDAVPSLNSSPSLRLSEDLQKRMIEAQVVFFPVIIVHLKNSTEA